MTGHCAGRQPVDNGHHPVCRKPIHLDGRCWSHYWSSCWPLPIPGLPENPDPDWREQAACQGMDVDLFFMSKGERPPPEVVETCAGCPVRGDCLVEEVQISGVYQSGVWGGVPPSARLALMRRRGRRVKGCGTNAGYKRHHMKGTPPCGACKRAHAEYRQQRREAS